jgi:hypothetical protein
MGLTFTLTSFTCTAAFVGTVLVAVTQGEWFWPAVGHALLLDRLRSAILSARALSEIPSVAPEIGWVAQQRQGGDGISRTWGRLQVSEQRRPGLGLEHHLPKPGSRGLDRDLRSSTALYLLGKFLLPHDSEVATAQRRTNARRDLLSRSGLLSF